MHFGSLSKTPCNRLRLASFARGLFGVGSLFEVDGCIELGFLRSAKAILLRLISNVHSFEVSRMKIAIL